MASPSTLSIRRCASSSCASSGPLLRSAAAAASWAVARASRSDCNADSAAAAAAALLGREEVDDAGVAHLEAGDAEREARRAVLARRCRLNRLVDPAEQPRHEAHRVGRHRLGVHGGGGTVEGVGLARTRLAVRDDARVEARQPPFECLAADAGGHIALRRAPSHRRRQGRRPADGTAGRDAKATHRVRRWRRIRRARVAHKHV
mmetsp:Transcript_34706/g.104189  ORF Transcript_34706/g.104189 Transcript_34706/m.104189 type:complete len:204 (+) Transcript_34706:448-1059(+)